MGIIELASSIILLLVGICMIAASALSLYASWKATKSADKLENMMDDIDNPDSCDTESCNCEDCKR